MTTDSIARRPVTREAPDAACARRDGRRGFLDEVGPGRTSDRAPPATARYRSIWISDLHLGTPGCQAALVLALLRRTESDYLYLVGDIVDGRQLRRRWHWPQAHNDVVQKLFRKARKGTRVIYVPGNHDGMARQFGAMAFGGVRVETETIHVTADGRRLLVIHGDRFDGVVRHAKWLAHLGEGACAAALKLNRCLNALRAGIGLPCWSLAQFLKLRVDNARRYVGTFEGALVSEARRLGVHGVVCGHIHKPEIRMVDGILYCNDGDWVDSLTALVETEEGELQLIDWQGNRLPTGAVATSRALARHVPGPARPRSFLATSN